MCQKCLISYSRITSILDISNNSFNCLALNEIPNHKVSKQHNFHAYTATGDLQILII